MSRVDDIRARLGVLEPHALDIEDESALHAGHAGARSGGGHYRVTIIADCFRTRSTVARHRMIYDALGDLMRGPIHALAIRALTTEEASISPNRKEP